MEPLVNEKKLNLFPITQTKAVSVFGADNFNILKFEDIAITYSRCEQKTADLVVNESKIMIVDDDEAIIDLIEPVFNKSGFKTCYSTNVYDAMITLNKELPLILTLDLRMPDSHGLEILKMLRDMDMNQKIWVVVISGASDIEIYSALALGADYFLKKPFHRKDLNKIVQKISFDFKNKGPGFNNAA